MKYALLAATLFVSPALAQNCKPTNQGFTVTSAGFTDPNGRPWQFRGVNMDVPDALAMMDGFLRHYPGTTAIRMVAIPDRDSMETLDQLVLYYTGKGIALVFEDHADSQGGQNVGWYTQVANRYKTNALVFLETPNEPKAEMTGAPQAAIINAVRTAGFTNPIGIQPIGGYNQANIPSVLAGVTSRANLYVTPHVYCDDSGGPSCPTSYANAAAQPSNDLFSVIDEFGDAMDGMRRNTYGLQVITAVINVAQSGRAGAAFWHASNGYHPDGADSACTNQSCSSISITGQMIQPWLSSQPPTGPCSLMSQTSLPNAATQKALDPINQQTDAVQQQITKIQQGMPKVPPPSSVPPPSTPSPAPSFTGYNPTFTQAGQQAQQQLQSIQEKIRATQQQIQTFDPVSAANDIVTQSQANPAVTSPAGTALDPAPTPKKKRRHNDGDADDQ